MAWRTRPPMSDRALPWIIATVLLGVALGMAAATGKTIIIAGILLVPALVWLLLRPDWLPAVLTVTVFMEAITLGNLTISRMAGPLAFLVLLLQLRRDRPLSFPDRRMPIVLCAYGLWALASALWTVNFDSSLQQGGTGFALSSLLLSTIYLVAVAVLVNSERDVQRLVVVVWAMSTVMGLLAIGEFVGGQGRAVGVTGDANFFASLQIVAIPIGAVLASSARRRGARAVILLGVAISVGSVLTSLSRGGILSLVALALLLAFQPAQAFFRSRARKRAFLAVLVVGAGALLMLSYGALSARTSSLFSTADGGSGRANLWRAAETGLREHPVRGLGFGAFQSQSNQLMRRSPGVDFSAYRLRPGGQPVHNAYLESLVELGVFGGVLFLAVLASIVLTLRRAARRAAANDAPFLSAVCRALVLSLAGFAFTSIFLSTETDRTLWIMMGLALALSRIVARPAGRGPALR